MPWCLIPWSLIRNLIRSLPNKEPNAMESDTGPKVLCCNLLVWALLSLPLLSEL
jgi:hypothetical protein